MEIRAGLIQACSLLPLSSIHITFNETFLSLEKWEICRLVSLLGVYQTSIFGVRHYTGPVPPELWVPVLWAPGMVYSHHSALLQTSAGDFLFSCVLN